MPTFDITSSPLPLIKTLTLFLLPALIVAYFYRDGLSWVVNSWSREEYSHAYLIPFISAYLLWQKYDVLKNLTLKGSWTGASVVALGVGIMLLGELATLYAVIGYGFVTLLIGVYWSITGWKIFKESAPALFLLFFMIPLPSFVFNNLSSELQLISSQIGVMIIRLFGISVYLEGNVIDLGSMKLQVVEACSGLRYLFPLMTLAFMMSLLFKASWWKRTLLFLSSIPITVIMNSIRIGIIGVLVEYWGTSMAEGFLHDFEGWAVFMAAFGLLALEMWVLVKLGGSVGGTSTPLVETLENSSNHANTQAASIFKIPLPYASTLLILVPLLILTSALPDRDEIPQQRQLFADFPMQLGEWKGTRDLLDELYLDALDLDDYVLANYTTTESKPINFYVAWYDSQSKGESAHSPKSCLPGGGWRMTDFGQVTFPSIKTSNKKPLTVNRTLIEMNETKQLVYYWFQQRGRNITNEYLVKWFLFWDSLTRNRSDGALVRLTTVISSGDTVVAADKRLQEFLGSATPSLHSYIPD